MPYKIYTQYKLFRFVIFITSLWILLFISNFYGVLSFQTNDEYALSSLLSGNYTDYLNTDAYFIGPLISVPLSFMYRFNGTFPWYGSFHLLTISLSIYLLWETLKYSMTNVSFVQRIILLAPIMSMAVWFSFSLQFTQTAVIATASGVFLFLKGFESKQKITLSNKSLGTLSIIFGLSWRIESGFLAILYIFTSYLIIKVILKRQNPFELNFIVNVVGPILAILILVVSSDAVQDKYEQGKSEATAQNFEELNSARGNIHGWQYDFLDEKVEKSLRKEIGWSPNDLKLFKSFFFTDENIYSVSNLEKYSFLYQQNLYFGGLFDFKAYILNFYEEMQILFIIIVLFNISLYLLFGGDKRSLTALASNLVLFSTVVASILLISSIPPRVFYSLIFLGLLNSMYIFSNIQKKVSSKFNSLGETVKIILKIISNKSNKPTKKSYAFELRIKLVFASIFTILITVLFIFYFGPYFKKSINYRTDVCQNQNYYLITDFLYSKPILAFPSFTSAISECINPLDSPQKFKNFWKKVIPLGWTVRSPQYYDKLTEMGLSSDLIDELVSGEIYLGVANNLEIQMISQFALEHKNVRITWEETPLAYSGNNLQVWKIKNNNLSFIQKIDE